MWRCRFIPAVLVVIAGMACPARALADVRLVVKYRAALDACIDCLVNRGAPLVQVSGDNSLDQLHARLRVARAEALIPHLGISQTIADAVATAQAAGVVVIAAAGNSGGSVTNFTPAGASTA